MGYIGNSVVGVEHPSKSALNATTGAFTGAVTAASTLGVTGAVTANAGVAVDNITIDGTEIDLSSGDLTLDVAGDIILDADGGDIILKDGGTQFGQLYKNGNDFRVESNVSDGDLVFTGNDGGTGVTALTLDMSNGGAATLNNGLTLTDGDLVLASGHGISFAADGNASGMSNELLNDYEEGTWTPTFDTGYPSGDPEEVVSNAAYTKIGNTVVAVARIQARNDATGMQLGGLPFNSNSDQAGGTIAHDSHTARKERIFDGNDHINWEYSSTSSSLANQYFMIVYTTNS